MGIAKIRSLASLAAAMLIASCMQHQTTSTRPSMSARTVTFHNRGRDRIQVYLIGANEEWLLGRLEPLETVHLKLPESSSVAGEPVVLAVIPGWSRSPAPRRDRRAMISVAERSSNLPGEEWTFVNGQVQALRLHDVEQE